MFSNIIWYIYFMKISIPFWIILSTQVVLFSGMRRY